MAECLLSIALRSSGWEVLLFKKKVVPASCSAWFHLGTWAAWREEWCQRTPVDAGAEPALVQSPCNFRCVSWGQCLPLFTGSSGPLPLCRWHWRKESHVLHEGGTLLWTTELDPNHMCSIGEWKSRGSSLERVCFCPGAPPNSLGRTQHLPSREDGTSLHSTVTRVWLAADETVSHEYLLNLRVYRNFAQVLAFGINGLIIMLHSTAHFSGKHHQIYFSRGGGKPLENLGVSVSTEPNSDPAKRWRWVY